MPILTPHERIGTVVAGRYRLDAILGVGGMGVVFSSVHTWTGRPVAVKILSPEYALNATVAQRFLQEARAAARLRHTNIVDVLDMGQDEDGTVFLVLELLQGESLGALVEREAPLAPGRTIDLLVPVMKALWSVHRRGIVHRDVKPDNIFLSIDESGSIVPKLLDFGVAKVTDSAQRGTHAGAVLGTPHYMSPEQAAGSENVGAQADVWSMGVVLYECLAGVLPFGGNNPTAVLLAIACGNPVKLEVSAPHLSREIANAVELALVPDRRMRYPTMREFVDGLLAAAAANGIGLQSATPVRSDPPTGLRARGDDSKQFEVRHATPRSEPKRGSAERSDPQAETIAADHPSGVDGASGSAQSGSVQGARPASDGAAARGAGPAPSTPGASGELEAIPVPTITHVDRVPRRGLLVASGAAVLVLALFLLGGWMFGDHDAVSAQGERSTVGSPAAIAEPEVRPISAPSRVVGERPTVDPSPTAAVAQTVAAAPTTEPVPEVEPAPEATGDALASEPQPSGSSSHHRTEHRSRSAERRASSHPSAEPAAGRRGSVLLREW